MQIFSIYEGNMKHLQSKIARIQNKCSKYGCQFHFQKVGENFQEFQNDCGFTVVKKFISVEVEGIAIINNWKFIASVEHTENGNIIKGVCDIEVPKRYYNSDCYCEHCNSKRNRKNTFIVMNRKSGEFKQVGKSCLKDFTNGMNAELVTEYVSMFDDIIQSQSMALADGWNVNTYYKTSDLLCYAAETIKKFGYVKATETNNTKSRVCNYYSAMEIKDYLPKREKIQYQKEMESVSFDAYSNENKNLVSSALDWLKDKSDDSTYIHNLKVVCGAKYFKMENIGILVSLIPTFEKSCAVTETSNFIGNIGDRVEVSIKSCECVASYNTNFGITRIYKLIDNSDNVLIWKTSKIIDTTANFIKGTIKKHNEYSGIKQTELTRCSIR